MIIKKIKNGGGDSNMVLLYGGRLGDTIIAGNIYLSGNIIPESIYFVLSYLHIVLHTGDAKYRI